MRGVTRMVVVPAVLLLASGCATKGYVRELVGKSEQELDMRVGKVGERVVAVEGRLGEESQRVTRVEGQLGETNQRLGGVETKVGEAKAKADSAFNRADEVDNRRRHAYREIMTIQEASLLDPKPLPCPLRIAQPAHDFAQARRDEVLRTLGALTVMVNSAALPARSRFW